MNIPITVLAEPKVVDRAMNRSSVIFEVVADLRTDVQQLQSEIQTSNYLHEFYVSKDILYIETLSG